MKKKLCALLLALAILLAGCGGMAETTQTLSACQKQGHIWQDATCTDAKICTVCGETEGEALGHAWKAATCVEPKTCTRCSLTEGTVGGHVWQDATCTAPKTCGGCGLTEGEALGHVWQDASCAAPRTCTVCGETEGEVLEHLWQDATCTAPETCSACGETAGEALGHNWQNATCAEPRTCTACGETEGAALGHVWQDATCTTAKKCSVCGATSGDALGHDLSESADGSTRYCNRCGDTVTIKYIAITFDDGPSGSVTKNLLTGLEARGVHATFFICGYRINSYPSYPQMILDYGHEIGLHTVNHANLTKLNQDGIRKELEGMLNQLPAGYQVRLMRPPGGAYNSSVKAVCLDMGLSIVMWSVDPQDWATNDVDLIVSRIVNGASHGGIILMHDLKSSSVTAALKAIDKLQDLGYEVVSVSKLAQIMGKTLEPGQVYYSIK